MLYYLFLAALIALPTIISSPLFTLLISYLSVKMTKRKDMDDCLAAVTTIIITFLGGVFVVYRAIHTENTWTAFIPDRFFTFMVLSLVAVLCVVYAFSAEGVRELADSKTYWVIFVCVYAMAFQAPFYVYEAVKDDRSIVVAVLQSIEGLAITVYLRLMLISNQLKPPSNKKKEPKTQWKWGGKLIPSPTPFV